MWSLVDIPITCFAGGIYVLSILYIDSLSFFYFGKRGCGGGTPLPRDPVKTPLPGRLKATCPRCQGPEKGGHRRSPDGPPRPGNPVFPRFPGGGATSGRPPSG